MTDEARPYNGRTPLYYRDDGNGSQVPVWPLDKVREEFRMPEHRRIERIIRRGENPTRSPFELHLGDSSIVELGTVTQLLRWPSGCERVQGLMVWHTGHLQPRSPSKSEWQQLVELINAAAEHADGPVLDADVFAELLRGFLESRRGNGARDEADDFAHLRLAADHDGPTLAARLKEGAYITEEQIVFVPARLLKYMKDHDVRVDAQEVYGVAGQLGFTRPDTYRHRLQARDDSGRNVTRQVLIGPSQWSP